MERSRNTGIANVVKGREEITLGDLSHHHVVVAWCARCSHCAAVPIDRIKTAGAARELVIGLQYRLVCLFCSNRGKNRLSVEMGPVRKVQRP